MTDDNPEEIPIDGVLDLHTFRPQDLGSLIPEYIRACREKDIYSVRIIHGKGKGVLRRTVITLLEQHPDVVHFETAKDRSGWGATWAELRRSD